jgi:oligopeptide/dipeptide ABC transporter ATP-binding protein
MSADAILTLDRLSVRLPKGADRAYALSDVSLQIASNEILCVVGESGSGKSMMANAVMRLLPNEVAIDNGRIMFEGRDLCATSTAEMRQVRGAGIAMIFQEPMTALNPLRTTGDQIGEMFSIHTKLSKADIKAKVLALLADVHIPDPAAAAKAYPHELSGGQRQRAMIAMALALDPKLLIADEPTTALDVTVQAEIIDLMAELCAAKGTAILMISHDLGLVANMCRRVAVMYAGRIVESQVAGAIFATPRHPYTQGLVDSLPRLGERSRRGQQRLREISGVVPSIAAYPGGCRFNPRCPAVTDICRSTAPDITPLPADGLVRCHHHG